MPVSLRHLVHFCSVFLYFYLPFLLPVLVIPSAGGTSAFHLQLLFIYSPGPALWPKPAGMVLLNGDMTGKSLAAYLPMQQGLLQPLS